MTLEELRKKNRTRVKFDQFGENIVEDHLDENASTIEKEHWSIWVKQAKETTDFNSHSCFLRSPGQAR